MTGTDDLKQAVQALAAEERRAQHPEPGELIAYSQGALAEERRDQLQEHLASCAECARLLVDFADFDGLAPPDGGERLTDAEVAAARRLLERRIEMVATVASPAAAVRGARWTGAFASPRPWQLLTAALAAAVIGLAVFGGSQHQLLRRLGQPEVNVATHDLEPVESDQLQGGPSAAPTVIDGATRSAVLILQLHEVESHPAYRVAIRGSDSRQVWSRAGAARDPVLGNFTLRLPPGALPPGRYDVEIFGVGDDREELLARYAIEVR